METTNGTLGRKLRMGIVGGGPGSFIGRVHVTAAVLDNRAEIVAGAFSSSAERSREAAAGYAVDESRAYGSFQEMLDKEKQRDDGIDFVTVATPNHMHFPVAKAALEAGYHVICDKPMTLNYEEAEELLKVVEGSPRVFALTHNYTGYPMVRQVRDMVQAGELGEINAIRVQYIQGWMREKLEDEGQKQAAWRSDPKKSGAAGAFGDIATHAFNLARFMTGLIPDQVSAHLRSFVDGRVLDDYGTAMVTFENGALASVTASQISHGRENDLEIEVDGTKKAIKWRQEEPNTLVVRENGEPHKLYTRAGGDYLTENAAAAGRLPSGHPEAFFEAFANVYRAAYDAIAKVENGEEIERRDTLYPNVYDGVEGMYFIQQCVASSNENANWLPLKYAGARK